MRIRMYLRGLGIGIVVTALIMGITSGKKQTMTDEEIKSKAAALGMVEQESVLKPVISEEPQTVEPAPEEEETQETEVIPEPEVTQAEEPAEAEEAEKAKTDSETNGDAAGETTGETKAEVKTEESDKVKTTGTFTLEIAGGYDSVKVCQLLEKGGVIASASDFDQYLCDHGYDHTIRTGKYSIKAGSDYETIAKIITGR